MNRFIKYILSLFYANSNYSKYGSGNEYYFSLLGGTFIIVLTLILFLSVLLSIFPDFYRIVTNFSSKVNGKVLGVLLSGTIFIILKFSFKREDLEDSSLTKEIVTRGINYLLVYMCVVAFVVGLLALKVLRQYKHV